MNLFRQLMPFQKKFIVYVFPPVLIIVNYFAFHFFVELFGKNEGYLAGTIFYWLLFCTLPVMIWIGSRNRKLLFKIKRINWWQIILVLLPPVVTFLFGPFKSKISEVNTLIIVSTLDFALVNSCCEEYLWRGLFFNYHQGNFFFAVIVPSIWFAVWHYVPLSIHPAEQGNFYFILTALGMGLCWAIVTFYTRSVFWAVVSHALVNLFVLGGTLFFG
ncbi:MAG: hypothetical protein B6D37_12650 [Sphingobacteriales bacterium UTBCD1]|jgi:membrane protease YdiL (CAAX protease family)|nr:MAG: hypothetical protein B6D37_12650 [Sphingobacteriales bacterium UTBCD1]